MTDPKLVEALESFVGDVAAMPVRREVIEAFVRKHRLVQLPEEPIGWVPVDEKRVAILGGVRKSRQDAEAYALPVHPIYIIPEATND